ncbi:hypothetical protein TMatcc_008846 [Talaromyces marneffei ATCC 18224]|uniref:Uncharacterized protein n=1 Tax=Talaromyces marneffei (strain ATCC 18224 / CBS 334.59 / QM 7333) TaxID=441960 RepID=B6QKV3_TALMQ|nr:conserved hypothetical protein [Talaromyces marneffei ATCC 18224]
MAPAVKRSYDEETQSSDWTNEHPGSPPVKRPRSEPTQTLQGFNNSSIEASLSPPVSDHHQINCPWCSESFDAPEDGVISAHNALKKHITLAHPRIANLSAHDDQSKDDDSEITMPEHIDLVNTRLKGVLSSNVAAVTAPATDVDVTPAGSETPGIDLSLEAADTLDSKLHDLERQQVHAANAEKRLVAGWNFHDARKFNKDYDDATADLEDSWCYVFGDSKPTTKKGHSKKPTRPDPYLSSTAEKGEFLKLTPVEQFLDSLNDFESMPTDQLHAAAQNVYHALKTWQDEWMAIEELNKRVTNKPKKSSNPRALDPIEVFQDKREAMLYGYKYDPTIHEPKKREANNETTFKCQDPFVQGGFRPTAAQLRKMQTEAGKNNINPDGFKTMTRNGQEYVPKFQDPPLIPFDSRGSTNRKRKLPQGEIAALRQPSVHDSTTAFESDLDGQPFKRVTRSVNKTENPQTQTAPPSPGPRPHGKKRKARGGASHATQPTNITSNTIQPTNHASNITFKQTSYSNIAGSPTGNTLSFGHETVPSSSSRAITSPPVDGLTSVASSEQADMTPAPMPALAPAAPGAPPALAALPQPLAEPGEVLSEAELRRRDKIANSKNPRRTIAMLDHWDNFHKDGRTRKPKRTKEQMEADRVADESRRANGQGKAPKKRKRRAATTTTTTVDSPAIKQQGTTATATSTAIAATATTATTSTTVSLQPISIQPAATSATTAPVAPPPPPPPPPARIMTQTYPVPLNEPLRPQPSRGFPSLHPLIPVAPPEPQPTMASYNSQPVLPGVDRNTAPPPPPPPRWTAPSQYYTYGNPPPLSPYHPYRQPQYPPPPPPPPPSQIQQPPLRDTGHPETIQPSANYPFDPRRPLPPFQNPPRP